MIQVEQLTKVFGSRVAVDNLSFTLPEGGVLAVLGPNGAGKTTTVRMLLGLIEPTSGSAWIAGMKLGTDNTKIRRLIGATGEYPGLYLKMNIEEYLRYFGRLYGVATKELRLRMNKYMELFGLNTERERPLGQYSRGMQQRAVLCRALIHEPPILFLDEPTSGLDPGSAYDLRNWLQLIRRDERRTILLGTHILEEAEQLADEVLILDRGQVVAKDSLDHLQNSLKKRRYRLTMLHPVSCLMELIKEVPYLLDVTVDPQGSKIEFSTEAPEYNSQLLHYLLEAGVPVYTLSTVSRSLEEAYLSLTRGEDRP
jgi:ABC-2 type transport system ATP-binding protein